MDRHRVMEQSHTRKREGRGEGRSERHEKRKFKEFERRRNSRDNCSRMMSPSRPHPDVMVSQTAHSSRLCRRRPSQLPALAVELSYYLDRLYATATITISHRALYCDADTQTNPVTSPFSITHSTQSPLHSWNYRYTYGAYNGLRINPASAYASPSPPPFSPSSPEPLSSNSSTPPILSPVSLNPTSPVNARSPSPGCSYINLD
ncbi:uncharacterized [Tachysurus ichikawai]